MQPMKPSRLFASLGVLLLGACGGGEEAADAQAGRAVYAAAPPVEQATATQPAAARAAGPAASSAALVGDNTLGYPEDLEMVMLGYRLRSLEPPLAEWAAATSAVRFANEFDRTAVLQRETSRLAAAYEATAGVGFVQLRTSSTFSEYDGTRGGYYVNAFAPGTVYTFESREPVREKVTLQLANAQEAYFWPLDAAAAEEVLRTNFSRGVNIDAKVAVTGAIQRASGTVITGRILRYDILSTRYGNERALAQITIP